MQKRFSLPVFCASLFLSLSGLAQGNEGDAVRVFATTPDLADLTRLIGGDRVEVVEMVKGREDPHFAEARPSFVRELSRADLFLQIGLELEAGYVPLLLENARNPRVLPGAPGFADASRAITPLDVPAGAVDRSMGDVHRFGSPHYMLDPVRGFAVARLITEKLSALRPSAADEFGRHLDELRTRLATAMVGAQLASKYDAFKLAELAEKGGLQAFLEGQGDRSALGGWYAAMLPLAGTKIVDDHAMWTYFARRFGLEIVAHLEPKAGIPPTTKHLGEVIELMKTAKVRGVIASPYYDPRHAELVAKATGARVVQLAHQAGGRPGSDDYVEMIDYNVRTTAAALAGTP